MEIPSGKAERRLLLALVIAVMGIVLLGRWAVVPLIAGEAFPRWDVVVSSILDEFLAALIVGAVLGFGLFWLLPSDSVRAEVAIVPSHERGEVLDHARHGTEEYWFVGATARYTRAETLPDLARQARQANRRRRVVIQVLDPANGPLCQTYAQYRNAVRSGRQGPTWDVATVQTEIFASIVLAYAWKREEPLLDVTVGLRPSLSLFRFDLGSNALIMTKEDPLEPALRCDEHTFFYNAFRDDLELSLKQCRALPEPSTVPVLEKIDPVTVEAFLGELGFDPSIIQPLASNVAALASDPVNPYA